MECPSAEAQMAASCKDVQQGKQGGVAACSKGMQGHSSKRRRVAPSASSHDVAEAPPEPEAHARMDKRVSPPDDDFM